MKQPCLLQFALSKSFYSHAEGEYLEVVWVYKAIAKLGGFTDSRRTGIAGWDTLWKGWDKLQERVQGMLMAKQMLTEGIDLDEI